MPRKFRSKAQQRWAFATKQPFAKVWAKRTARGAKGGSKRSVKAFRALPNKRRRS